MLGEKHALIIEFPELHEKINALKATDAHFKQMSDRYHQLDHKIRGLENNKIPTDDSHFTQLKLERVQLKDKLFSILSN